MQHQVPILQLSCSQCLPASPVYDSRMLGLMVQCVLVRMSNDGDQLLFDTVQVCLFGANEVSLRDAMREGASDDDLRIIVSAAVDRKKAAHAGMFEIAKNKNRPMVHIGG